MEPASTCVMVSAARNHSAQGRKNQNLDCPVLLFVQCCCLSSVVVSLAAHRPSADGEAWRAHRRGLQQRPPSDRRAPEDRPRHSPHRSAASARIRADLLLARPPSEHSGHATRALRCLSDPSIFWVSRIAPPNRAAGCPESRHPESRQAGCPESRSVPNPANSSTTLAGRSTPASAVPSVARRRPRWRGSVTPRINGNARFLQSARDTVGRSVPLKL